MPTTSSSDGDDKITYREANETANRLAAVLADKGVGRGDVVGIMLRNSPHAVLMMLAAVKCGAVAGMLNYHQRGDVLSHSIGLLDAKVVIAESDLIDAITESGAEVAELVTIEDFEEQAKGKPTDNPASASQVQAKDTRSTSSPRVHRAPQGQCDDPPPVAARAGGVRRIGVAAQQQ